MVWVTNLTQHLTVEGLMEDSFHLRRCLRSGGRLWPAISLWSMKFIVGGMLEKKDCLRDGVLVLLTFATS